MLNGLILILFVAALAGTRGGVQTALVGFAPAWFLGLLFSQGIAILTGRIAQTQGFQSSSWVVTVLLLLTVVVLIPVRGELFSIDPPERGRSLVPVKREPVVAALLSCFVPFYLVYWIYRIHGEEAYVRPSRQLLSPRAAAWISVIPLVGAFLFPIMLSTLADHHNEVAEASGIPRVQRPWAVFLWSVLFSPVAVGLVQAKLNELVARQAHIEPQLSV